MWTTWSAYSRTPVVVGDNHYGPAAVMGEAADHFHDDPAAVGVERGGGFVGEDDFGISGQGTGDGDALLLAST